jgi:hypothetical protein
MKYKQEKGEMKRRKSIIEMKLKENEMKHREISIFSRKEMAKEKEMKRKQS